MKALEALLQRLRRQQHGAQPQAEALGVEHRRVVREPSRLGDGKRLRIMRPNFFMAPKRLRPDWPVIATGTPPSPCTRRSDGPTSDLV